MIFQGELKRTKKVTGMYSHYEIVFKYSSRQLDFELPD